MRKNITFVAEGTRITRAHGQDVLRRALERVTEYRYGLHGQIDFHWEMALIETTGTFFDLIRPTPESEGT